MTDWLVATVVGAVMETPTSRSLWLRIPGFPGAAAGQHIDIRLTAPDGYSASRSYSLSDVREGEIVEVSVEELADGEVSPFLVRDLEIGEQVEVTGPIGGHFVWSPEGAERRRPVQLIAGGSGIAPLMAMIRLREVSAPDTRFRLLYSVRTPADVYYRDEFAALRGRGRLSVDIFYTRVAPVDSQRPPGRITRDEVLATVLPPEQRPVVYLCGADEFVGTVADWLVAAGHPTTAIRIERYLAA
ncbi:FAD-binding oxidoreductase [Williamsia sterculiae]|uniref:Ferredoxin-NADP reductase n=1 Tax=Williamsia sterculiae TaxID=1344003 RepID=A0A1N7CGB6_9NOCA|nr:FAD-binding oxidoreductase [Williamsia sterculiae]SIR62474.1 Ferredoxin-NADP reductase [Williamsia sterculiae]